MTPNPHPASGKRCEGGVIITSKPCQKCGATARDRCRRPNYEQPVEPAAASGNGDVIEQAQYIIENLIAPDVYLRPEADGNSVANAAKIIAKTLAAAGLLKLSEGSGDGKMREALEAARRAIGEHHAPNDCYATGPMTGNPMRDLVECPACIAIPLIEAALAGRNS